MSAQPAVVKPAVIPRASTGNRSFLSDVVVDFGPVDVLGRVFLKADTELREMGLTLSFGTLGELIDINRRNSDSWRPLLPLFDPEVGGITPETSIVLIGRNAAGEAVTAQAARLYSLTSAPLKEEMESLRFFYADPARSRLAGEAVNVSAPTADNLYGRAVFGGAVWFRPDQRRRGVVQVLSRVVKALTLTRWDNDIMFSIMAEDVVKGGVAQSAGFPHVEWSVDLIQTPVRRDGVIRSALIWTDAAEQIAYCRKYLAAGDAQVDRVVHDRAANQKLAG